DALRTVFFADRRHSIINIQQSSLRVTRRHPEKDIGNIVIPVLLEDSVGDTNELQLIVRALTAISPNLGERIAERYKRKWFRTYFDRSSPRPKNAQISELAYSKLLDTMMFDRLGICLDSRNAGPFMARVDALKAFVSLRGRLPKQYTAVGAEISQEEVALGKWLAKLGVRYRRGLLAGRDVNKLAEVPGLKEKLALWDECAQKLDTTKDFFQTVEALSRWVESNGQLPSTISAAHSHSHSQLPSTIAARAAERSLGESLKRVQKNFRRGLLPPENITLLEAIPGMTDKLKLWRVSQEFFKRRASWGDNFDLLARWIEPRNGTLPNFVSKDLEERYLGLWINDLGQSYKRGKLPQENIEQLLKLRGMKERIDTWSIRCYVYRGDWKEVARRIEAWMLQHRGHQPQRGSLDAKERILAEWLHKLKIQASRGIASDEQLDFLRSLPLRISTKPGPGYPRMVFSKDTPAGEQKAEAEAETSLLHQKPELAGDAFLEL
ncbi:unnamed protein product, partial [Polarella glacialis]